VSANSIPTPQRHLTIEHRVSGDGTPMLVCHGRITSETSGQFKSEVKSLAPQHQQLLADLSGVDFVDSSGLGTVLAAYTSAKSAGCELKLVKVHPYVKDLLIITHLSAILEGQGQ